MPYDAAVDPPLGSISRPGCEVVGTVDTFEEAVVRYPLLTTDATGASVQVPLSPMYGLCLLCLLAGWLPGCLLSIISSIPYIFLWSPVGGSLSVGTRRGRNTSSRSDAACYCYCCCCCCRLRVVVA
jgi:hypothetical protein